MANTYDLGDLVTVDAVFETVAGAAQDPDAVNLAVRSPDGVVTTYVYGTDAEIVKDSVGNYHANIDANQAGEWFYRWYSTGDGQAADENSFLVVTAQASSSSSPSSYTPTLTLYASQADVEFVWSEFGVVSRVDDDINGAADGGLMDRGLEKSTADVNHYLAGRYTLAVIAASTWARWATAYIAAVAIGRRRGNPMPEGLLAEAQAYLDELKLIRDGAADLIGDDGTLATPQFDNIPAVSNLSIDMRYRRAQIRRDPITSTGGQQTDGRKQFNDPSFILGE